MIKLSDICFDKLPWVPLSATAGFPAQPGIYFAVDSQNNIQYIGRSKDVKGRWKKHHRFSDLEAIGGVRIAYLFIETVELLPDIESALIEWFNPPLNKVRNRSPLSDDDPVLVDDFVPSKRLRSRLRILMAEQDPPLTQSDLIARLKLGNHTVSKLYNNSFQRVDADTVEKLCDFFGCGIQDLFELKDVSSD